MSVEKLYESFCVNRRSPSTRSKLLCWSIANLLSPAGLTLPEVVQNVAAIGQLVPQLETSLLVDETNFLGYLNCLLCGLISFMRVIYIVIAQNSFDYLAFLFLTCWADSGEHVEPSGDLPLYQSRAWNWRNRT